MSNAELLIEEIKTLPASRVEQALDFVEFIKQKEIDKAEGDDSWFGKGESCPICDKYREPVTGVPNYKPEVFAGMQEVEDMISGKIPVKRHNSLDGLDEMLGL